MEEDRHTRQARNSGGHCQGVRAKRGVDLGLCSWRHSTCASRGSAGRQAPACAASPLPLTHPCNRIGTPSSAPPAGPLTPCTASSRSTPPPPRLPRRLPQRHLRRVLPPRLLPQLGGRGAPRALRAGHRGTQHGADRRLRGEGGEGGEGRPRVGCGMRRPAPRWRLASSPVALFEAFYDGVLLV